MTKKKNIVLICLIFIGFCILCFSFFKNKKEPEPITQETTEEIEVEKYNPNFSEYEINDDFVGLLKFESYLIEEPIFQGETNESYLRTEWKNGNYDEEGAVFLDYENELDDQNLTIYGHYVYKSYDASGTHKFTPLSKLLDKENYEDNKYLSLYMKKEMRTYEIVAVYLCPITNGNTPNDLEYYSRIFDKEYFEKYKAAIKENQLYETGVDYNQEDRYLTLQTCVENHDELREIVLCKEISLTK